MPTSPDNGHHDNTPPDPCDDGQHQPDGAVENSTRDSRTHRPPWPSGYGQRPEWHVERIETEPMTTGQYDDAVHALSALITEWQNSRAHNARPHRKRNPKKPDNDST